MIALSPITTTTTMVAHPATGTVQDIVWEATRGYGYRYWSWKQKRNIALAGGYDDIRIKSGSYGKFFFFLKEVYFYTHALRTQMLGA